MAILPMVVAIFTVVDAGWWEKLKCRNTFYALNSLVFSEIKGRVFKREKSIPVKNVLAVTTISGPVLKKLGLVKLKLHNAIEQDSFGPFLPETAKMLKDQILIKAGNKNEDCL